MPAASPSFPPLIRWVVWLALGCSTLLYFGILQAGILELPDQATSGLKLPLTVAGFLVAGASVGLGMFVRGKARGSREGHRLSLPGTAAAFLAALALGEAAAVFGFVLGLLGHGMKDYLPLFVLGLGAILANHPGVFFSGERDE